MRDSTRLPWLGAVLITLVLGVISIVRAGTPTAKVLDSDSIRIGVEDVFMPISPRHLKWYYETWQLTDDGEAYKDLMKFLGGLELWQSGMAKVFIEPVDQNNNGYIYRRLVVVYPREVKKKNVN